MTVNRNRAVERAAVNALRALMERHAFIVQEIDGGNDHGEDVYVSFTEHGERTGDNIAVQIKGGVSYTTGRGYRVPVRKHADYWSTSNTPVYCVVQDPQSHELFWTNATAQVRRARRAGETIRSIRIDPADRLGDDTVATFALRARLYIAETGDFHRFLTKLSGVAFDQADYLAYFENLFGEQIIFRQERGKPAATLLHADLGWDHYDITEEDIAFTKSAPEFHRAGTGTPSGGADSTRPTIRSILLSTSERMWLEACFEESRWVRESGRGPETRGSPVARRVAPVLYSPWQELQVARRPWRQDPRVNDLMERFFELGYIVWHEDPATGADAPISPEARAGVWAELRRIVHRLKALRVPDYYLMANRGRLTRSELRHLLGQDQTSP